MSCTRVLAAGAASAVLVAGFGIVAIAATGTTVLGGRPVYELSLTFDQVSWEFVPQNPDGSPGPPVTEAWDLGTNTPL